MPRRYYAEFPFCPKTPTRLRITLRIIAAFYTYRRTKAAPNYVIFSMNVRRDLADRTSPDNLGNFAAVQFIYYTLNNHC